MGKRGRQAKAYIKQDGQETSLVQDLLMALTGKMGGAPEVARQLEVSKATVYRWLEGKSKPHSWMVGRIYGLHHKLTVGLSNKTPR